MFEVIKNYFRKNKLIKIAYATGLILGALTHQNAISKHVEGKSLTKEESIINVEYKKANPAFSIDNLPNVLNEAKKKAEKGEFPSLELTMARRIVYDYLAYLKKGGFPNKSDNVRFISLLSKVKRTEREIEILLAKNN